MTLEQYLEKLKEQYKDSVIPFEMQRLIQIIEVLTEALESLENLSDTDYIKSETESGETECWVSDLQLRSICEEAQAKVNEIIGGEG